MAPNRAVVLALKLLPLMTMLVNVPACALFGTVFRMLGEGLVTVNCCGVVVGPVESVIEMVAICALAISVFVTNTVKVFVPVATIIRGVLFQNA